MGLTCIVALPFITFVRQDYEWTLPDTRVLAKEWIEPTAVRSKNPHGWDAVPLFMSRLSTQAPLQLLAKWISCQSELK